jgi:hypothetical protein
MAVVRIGASAHVLRDIHKAETHLAVWRRALAPCLEWSGAASKFSGRRLWVLHADSLPALRAAASVDAGACVGADIALLAAEFFSAMECARIIVKLERIDDDACRKFHADYKTVRLITTYQGPGTQWIPGEETPVVTAKIAELNAGDVAMFKGRNYGAGAPPRILHRSPPITGANVTRLTLVIDAATGDIDGCGDDIVLL